MKEIPVQLYANDNDSSLQLSLDNSSKFVSKHLAQNSFYFDKKFTIIYWHN